MAKKATRKKPEIAVVEDAPPEPVQEPQETETSTMVAKAKAKPKAKPKTAKKRTENKSQKVRDYAADHPKATTQEIAEALKYEYTTVYQALKKPKNGNGKATKAKASKKTAAKAGTGARNGFFPISALALIKDAGGIDEAIETLSSIKAAQVPF